MILFNEFILLLTIKYKRVVNNNHNDKCKTAISIELQNAMLHDDIENVKHILSLHNDNILTQLDHNDFSPVSTALCGDNYELVLMLEEYIAKHKNNFEKSYCVGYDVQHIEMGIRGSNFGEMTVERYQALLKPLYKNTLCFKELLGEF